jgi:hypothetical protein
VISVPPFFCSVGASLVFSEFCSYYVLGDWLSVCAIDCVLMLSINLSSLIQARSKHAD